MDSTGEELAARWQALSVGGAHHECTGGVLQLKQKVGPFPCAWAAASSARALATLQWYSDAHKHMTKNHPGPNGHWWCQHTAVAEGLCELVGLYHDKVRGRPSGTAENGCASDPGQPPLIRGTTWCPGSGPTCRRSSRAASAASTSTTNTGWVRGAPLSPGVREAQSTPQPFSLPLMTPALTLWDGSSRYAASTWTPSGSSARWTASTGSVCSGVWAWLR